MTATGTARPVSDRFRGTAATVAPYLAWMVLMMALPRTAAAYAVRAGVTAVLLVWPIVRALRVRIGRVFPCGGFAGLAEALVAGAVVCAAWIYPDSFDWYRRLFVIGGTVPSAGPSPYDPAVCGWPLAWARLLGSAFVIAPAEELFFRSFLYRRLQAADWSAVKLSVFDASAFFWTVGLFALEHDRWLAAVFAGAVYGVVAMRRGIVAASVAHAFTNLLLGAHVIYHGAWAFW